MAERTGVLLTSCLRLETHSPLRAQAEKLTQEEALAKIKERGGKVEIDGNSPGRPVTVVLSDQKFTDADLTLLKEIPNLHTVALGGAAISDAGLKELG